MARLLWDASALIKRYTSEIGTDTANALFASRTGHEMSTTPWGYVETYSALLRCLNRGVLDQASFAIAINSLRTEVVDSPEFEFLPITEDDIFGCITVMRRHNLNATDAAILTMLLEYLAAAPADGPLVVVASDQRLLRAAAAEGLGTLNPETLPAADVPAFLAGL